MASVYNFDEDKIHILTKSNRVFSYSYKPGADLQPLISAFKKAQGLAIEEVYIERKGKGPMEVVTPLYNIEVK